MLIKKSTKSAALRIWGFLPLILAAAVVITLLQGQKAVAQTDKTSPSVEKAKVITSTKEVSKPQEPEKVKAKQTESSKSSMSDQKKVQKKAKDDSGNEVFVVVDDPPQYPGGDEARMKYMQQSIKYPEEARKKGVQGTVFVSFVVEVDGQVSNAKILRGIGAGCDEEALRVIKEMPKWIPGKQNEKPVRVVFNIPIKFALGEGKK
jgi:TonB family protein